MPGLWKDKVRKEKVVRPSAGTIGLVAWLAGCGNAGSFLVNVAKGMVVVMI